MKISVCMATFNGARFVEEQVKSILSQIKPEDEVIICDDGSKDETVNILSSIGDSRIKIFAFDSNVGHVANFERALSRASGDVIFLSDQDDIWVEEKYNKVISCFQEDSSVHFVHHSLSTVDEKGRVLVERWNRLPVGRQQAFSFLFRQIVKCQIFGCAVAFRRQLLRTALPFPKPIYAHDHWLAILAGVCGSIYFIDQPLVRYRQHSNNVSPKNGLSWLDKFLVRRRLVLLLFIAMLRCSLSLRVIHKNG